MNKSILIVGAGLGGLTTALRLSKKGYKVVIVEKNSKAGGRLNQLKKDGFTFDTGPSFFSMSYEFEDFAKECNISLPFEYVELNPLYSVNFKGSAIQYDLYKEIDKLAEQFRNSEPDFELKMNRYLKKSERLFKDTVDLVIKKNFDSIFGYFITLARVNPRHLGVLFKNFWAQVNNYFSSQEATQIISLVAFFLGKTPFDTMAIYTLLSYTEFKHDGYYNVKGGMYKIVEGLIGELQKEGVQIVYNTKITDFKYNADGVVSFISDNGSEWFADSFVVNADAALFRGEVLKRSAYSPARLKKMDWTMGYLTFYLGIDCKLPEIKHHNYYLGSNFKEYSGKIKNDMDSTETPYYYVNVLSKHNDDCAPEGCESLFFVCPVPNLLKKSNWDDKEVYFDRVIDDFSERTGRNIKSHIISKTIYTPLDWREQFNLYMGSGLGLSHTFNQIGGFRPSNKDEKFNNLFYVGASTVPGAGLPMAVISSKLVTERVLNLK